MADAKPVFFNFRGGRNGFDPPYTVLPTQCCEAINVDWYGSLIGRKRGGATSIALTGGGAITGPVNFLFRNVPANDETKSELWLVDNASPPTINGLTGGVAWQATGFDDNITARAMDMNAVSFNSKLFLAYTSGIDRLHVHDGTGALGIFGNVRRVGLLAPAAAPTAADTGGAGAYPNTLRYYRIRFVILDPGNTFVIARSEPSPSVAFTPDGAHADVLVTRSAVAAGEPAGNWELEVSLDNINWFRFKGFGTTGTGSGSFIVIGTTTTTAGMATSAISGFQTSDPIGMYVVPTGVKYLITDGNRILMAGSTISGGKNNRVFWTPVLGSANQGEDERIPTTLQSYTDLEENAGDTITGFGGPLYAGTIIVFMYRRVWQLTPTANVNAPYLQRKISESIGSIAQHAVVMAEDEAGQPACYFLDPHKGPYRIGATGFQYLGHDVEDQWHGLNGKSAVNLAATNVVAWAAWYADIHQVWFFVATGSSNDPDTKLVFDTQLGEAQGNGEVRKGWSIHTGAACQSRCGAMFANTLGAAMSRDLKPYVGRSSGTTLLKCDTTATDDNGTAFQGYVTSPPVLPPAGLGTTIGVGETVLVAKPLAGCTIQQTLVNDFGRESRTSTVLLTKTSAPNQDETTSLRVVRKFEASALAQSSAVQVTLGDAAAVASGSWSLEALMVPIEHQGSL